MSRELKSGDLKRLVQRCVSGDGRAWDALVDHFSGLVYACCRRARLSDSDSEDAFQATFIALYRNLDRIDDPVTLPKWIAVTASREAIRTKRLSDRTSPLDEPDSLERLVDEQERDAASLAELAFDVDNVRRGLERLGGRCEDLLRRLFSEDPDPYEEIATALGIPVGAIGPTRARCLEKLRKDLEKRGFFES